MKNLITRALSGAVYVTVLISCALWYPEALAIFFLLVLVLSGFEFKKIINASNSIFYWLIPAYLFYVLGLLYPTEPARYLFLFFPLIHAMVVLVKQGDIQKELQNPAASVLYLSIPLACITHLRLDFVDGMVVPFFIMIWANDTGAYLVGKKFGKRLMAPKVSPKKTVEGLIGGIIFCVGAGIASSYYITELSTANAIGMGLVIAFFANIGDLFESALKRSANVKDSGHLFPGHGGFLDRFDSVIFAAPATLVYLKVFYPWL